MRDDLNEAQLTALRKVGYRTPSEKRRDRRVLAAYSAAKWLGIALGALLLLKACQFTQGYHAGDDMGCDRRGECS